MFDLSKVEIAPSKLSGGVYWHIYREPDGTLGGRVVTGPTEDGCLLIVPMGLAYERKLEEARKPYLQAIRAGRLTDQEGRDMIAEALAGTVLAGWWGIKAHGAEVPFSVEKAKELLADERWLALREFVLRAAQHRGSLLANEEEEARGN
jgi:hypothetical protein